MTFVYNLRQFGLFCYMALCHMTHNFNRNPGSYLISHIRNLSPGSRSKFEFASTMYILCYFGSLATGLKCFCIVCRGRKCSLLSYFQRPELRRLNWLTSVSSVEGLVPYLIRAREAGCAGALFLLRSLCSFISTAVWVRCMENMDNRQKRYYCMTYSVWNIRVTASVTFLEADVNRIPFDVSYLKGGKHLRIDVVKSIFWIAVFKTP